MLCFTVCKCRLILLLKDHIPSDMPALSSARRIQRAALFVTAVEYEPYNRKNGGQRAITRRRRGAHGQWGQPSGIRYRCCYEYLSCRRESTQHSVYRFKTWLYCSTASVDSIRINKYGTVFFWHTKFYGVSGKHVWMTEAELKPRPDTVFRHFRTGGATPLGVS